MKTNSISNIIEKIIYISLCIILFILPFPRGLFFEKEIMPVQLAIYIVFILWTAYKIVNKQKFQLNSYLAIGACILPIAYMLPTFLGYAVNKTEAINYVFRYIAYFAVFIIVSDMTKSILQLKIWLYAIMLSGLGAALLGIDSLAGGSIGQSLGFVPASIGFQFNRLYGVLQYPNTTGMHFGLIFFILVGISMLSDKKYIKSICSGLMFIMLTCLMLTLSRGAILFMPVIYILLIIFLPNKNNRIELVLTTIAPIIITLILYPILQSVSPIINADSGIASKVWIFTVLGIIATILISFGLLNLTDRLNKISGKSYNIGIAVLAIILIIALAIIWFSGLYTKIIPQELLDRFFNADTGSTSGRTDFYRDGFRAIKDYWLLGGGGGAWNSIYRSYQSYAYSSTEAHNMLLQVWLETGLLGILGYLFVLIAAIKTYIDCRKSNYSILSVVILLSTIIYALAHSMIDFNFSYFSIPLIVFTLLGALNGISNIKTESIKSFKLKMPVWIMDIVYVPFIVLIICFFVAKNYAAQATTIILEESEAGEGNTITVPKETLIKAAQKMEDAIKYNPWEIDYYVMYTSRPEDINIRMDLNKIYTWLRQTDPENVEALTLHSKAINKALELDPKNPEINSIAGKFFIEVENNFSKGIECLENALKYSPMLPSKYESVASAYYVLGEAYMEVDENTAIKYFERIPKLKEEVEKVNERALQPITLTENTLNYIQQAEDNLK